ncbi:MAG: Type 1 glutamine amidotransferase-like domain-containing protein [Candidatus Falkowbacteria bacterium]
MKLLLTSAGIYNKSIAKALLKLLGQPFKKSSMIYITTASNIDGGDKSWLIDDLVNFKKLGFASIDIIDIAAVNKDIYLPRLEVANVIVFGGGNEAYLMAQIKKSGLQEILPSLLKNKVYVGISAGSMVASEKLSNEISLEIFGEDITKYKIKKALGFINFQICPHLNSPHFAKNKVKNVDKIAQRLKETIYTIDNNTAIAVTGGKIEIISEGKWYKFN